MIVDGEIQLPTNYQRAEREIRYSSNSDRAEVYAMLAIADAINSLAEKVSA